MEPFHSSPGSPIRNGKVKTNPVRLVKQRKEGGNVIRSLRDHEQAALRAVIAEKYPDEMCKLDISLGTGMQLCEQYGTCLGWRVSSHSGPPAYWQPCASELNCGFFPRSLTPRTAFSPSPTSAASAGVLGGRRSLRIPLLPAMIGGQHRRIPNRCSL